MKIEIINKIREWLLIYLIITLAFFDRFNVFIPFLNSSHSLLKITVVLAALSFGGEILIKRNLSFFNKKTVLILLLFLLSYTISVYFSVNTLVSFKITTYYYVGVMLWLMFSEIINGKNIKKIINVYVFLLILSMLLKIVWLIYPNIYLVVVKFLLTNDSYWFINYLLSIGRLHIWDISLYLVFLLFYLAIFLKNKKRRLSVYILLILEIFFIVLSSSRTYLVVILLGLLVFSAYLMLYKKMRKLKILWLILSVGMFGGLLYANNLGMSNVWNRVINTFSDPRLSGRVDLGVEAWWQFSQSPLVGSGQNTYSILVPVNPYLWNMRFVEFMEKNGYIGDYSGPTGHSIVVYLSETGIFGFGLLLLMWIYFIMIDVKYLMDNRRNFSKNLLYLSFAIPSSLMFPLVNITDTPGSFEILMYFIFRGILFSSFWKDKEGVAEI